MGFLLKDSEGNRSIGSLFTARLHFSALTTQVKPANATVVEDDP